MYNYDLISCNNLLYPDILCMNFPNIHPQDGLVVFVDQAFRNSLRDPRKTYTLTLTGQNTCVTNDYVPKLGNADGNNCSPSYVGSRYENCETGESRVFGFPSGDPTQLFIRKDGDCECWKFVVEDNDSEELINSFTEYASCAECFEALQEETCPTGERTLSYAVKVKLPEPVPPNRGFKECCYTSKVFGDLSDAAPYKNDFTGVYYKRPTNNSTVSFKLVDTNTLTEYDLNDATYGVFQDFGGVQNDLSFYIVEWRKVLSLLGEGNYQIKQEVSTVGVAQDYYSNTFTLQAFSIDRADNTVRIDCVQNGYFVDEDVNFKDTGFKTSLRVSGFFGRTEPSFEQKNLTTRDYKSQQVTMSVNREYKYQGLKIPSCIADELFYFILKGNELFVSDYNKNNHSYNFVLLPVELQDNEGSEYQTLTRAVKINLLFTDRFKNNRKTNC